MGLQTGLRLRARFRDRPPDRHSRPLRSPGLHTAPRDFLLDEITQTLLGLGRSGHWAICAFVGRSGSYSWWPLAASPVQEARVDTAWHSRPESSGFSTPRVWGSRMARSAARFAGVANG